MHHWKRAPYDQTLKLRAWAAREERGPYDQTLKLRGWAAREERAPYDQTLKLTLSSRVVTR
jgi:hypothetical protein